MKQSYVVYRKKALVPPLQVVVNEQPVTISVAPDKNHHIIMALGDKWDLLASAGWAIRDVITDALDNNGEYITKVKGIGPATVKKIQEAANVS